MICDFAKVFCCISIRLLAAQFQIVLSKHLIAIFGVLFQKWFHSHCLPVEQLELADCLLALNPKEPIPFPQCQNGTGYGKPRYQKNIDSCPTLAHSIIVTLLNNVHSFLVEDVLNWPYPPLYLSQCFCQN